MTDWRRVRGLVSLVGDAVGAGTTGVERVHRTLLARPFTLAGMIPGMAAPAKGAHMVIDLATGATYSLVRLGSSAVTTIAGYAVDAAESANKDEA